MSRRFVLTVGLGMALVLLAVVAVAAPALAQPSAGASTAYVRVNQVGYPDVAPKRAYLMSPVAAPGAAFAVTDAGGATASAPGAVCSSQRWPDSSSQHVVERFLIHSRRPQFDGREIEFR